MIDTTPLPPPAPTSRPVDAPPADRTAERGWTTWLLAVAVGAVTAAVGGGLIGFVTMSASSSSCSPSDGWCELGAMLVGFAAGIVAGAVGYLVAGIITINRRRPRGQRAGLIAATLATPFVGVIALTLLGALLGTAG